MSTINKVNFSLDRIPLGEIVEKPDDFVFRCQEDKTKSKITIEKKGFWNWLKRNIFYRSQYKFDSIMGKVDGVVKSKFSNSPEPSLQKFSNVFNKSLAVAYLFTKKVQEYQLSNRKITLSVDLNNAVAFVSKKAFEEIPSQTSPPASVDKGTKADQTPPQPLMQPLPVSAPATGQPTKVPLKSRIALGPSASKDDTGLKTADLVAAKLRQTRKRSLSTGSAPAQQATPQTVAPGPQDKPGLKKAALAAAQLPQVGVAPPQQQQKEVSWPYEIGAEIYNPKPGNSCFFDAPLQALRASEEFRAAIFKSAPLEGLTDDELRKIKEEIQQCKDQLTAYTKYVPKGYEQQRNAYESALKDIRSDRNKARDELIQKFEGMQDTAAMDEADVRADAKLAIKKIEAFCRKMRNELAALEHLKMEKGAKKNIGLLVRQRLLLRQQLSKKLSKQRNILKKRDKAIEDIQKNLAAEKVKTNTEIQKLNDIADAQMKKVEVAWAPTQIAINQKRDEYVQQHIPDKKILEARIVELEAKIKPHVAFQIKEFFQTVEKDKELFKKQLSIKDSVRLHTWRLGDRQEDAREACSQILKYIDIPPFKLTTTTSVEVAGVLQPLYTAPTVTQEQAILLPLDVTSREDTFTLEGLLERRKFNEIYQKDKTVPAIQNVSIDSDKPPKLLPIWLQRFDVDNNKIENAVTIPITLQFSKQHYRLKSAVIHHGTTQAGHYITYCPREEDGKTVWYEFDDKKPAVNKKESKEIEADLSKNCYGLFYELVEEPAKPQNPQAAPNQGASAK